jgi:hypothetical protein
MSSEGVKRLEPWDELPDDKLAKVRAITEAVHKVTDNKEVNLESDTLKVSGQNWACVSFVSPSSNQKSNSIGMKIRGCFDHRDEAVQHVKRLIKLDPTFDIFICDMYNWCLVPPDPEKISDQNYQDETLNSIISEYKKNQIYAKEHFEERKREMMEQAADEAKRAVLRRMEEESMREMEQTQTPLVQSNDREVVDVTELEPQTLINGDTVSASEVMESMVNGCSKMNKIE